MSDVNIWIQLSFIRLQVVDWRRCAWQVLDRCLGTLDTNLSSPKLHWLTMTRNPFPKINFFYIVVPESTRVNLPDHRIQGYDKGVFWGMIHLHKPVICQSNIYQHIPTYLMGFKAYEILLENTPTFQVCLLYPVAIAFILNLCFFILLPKTFIWAAKVWPRS